MIYEEMVKFAYEDIVNSFEKEARTALFRKGFDESREMLGRRHKQLEQTGKVPGGKDWYRTETTSTIDGLIGPSRHSKGYNEPRFNESVELSKKYPKDRNFLLGQQANGPAIKRDQMKTVDALSNHGKTLDDIRKRAATKLGLNSVTTKGLNGPVVTSSRISQNPVLKDYMSRVKTASSDYEE